LLWLTAPGRTAQRPIPLPVRIALLALPLLAAWFDYAENNAIAAMLTAGPQVGSDLVARASFWTQAKWLAGLLTEVTCVMLLAIAFIRHRHLRRQS
jgi:hypothetical protein